MQTLMTNKILLGISISILTLGILWGVWKGLDTSASKAQKPVDLKITASDWQKGSASASATLVEYSDFQCPACKAYAPVVEQLIKNNSDKVHFIYRHYPLPQHQHAKLAAYYAEAAGMQGKFFDMHDKLFVGQNDWEKSDKPEDIFLKYAQELKLDIKKLQKDTVSETVKARIENHIMSGTAANINATPTFFLNGKKIASPQSLEAFEQLIKESRSN